MGLMIRKGSKIGHKTKWERVKVPEKELRRQKWSGFWQKISSKNHCRRVTRTGQGDRNTRIAKPGWGDAHSGVLVGQGGFPDQASQGGEIVEHIGQEDESGHPG